MSCPVCRGNNATIFGKARDVEYCTDERTYLYLQCQRCHSVYLDHPPVDRLHEIYPPNYYSYGGINQRRGLLTALKRRLDGRLMKRVLQRIPGEHISVMDIGGGSGWLLSLLREMSSRVAQTHVVDIDDSARACAEADGHFFHCVPVEEFKAPKQFDLILMLNLIEHVADPRAVLMTVNRLLSPQGLLLIKTPNTDTLDRRLFQRHYWGGFHCPRHWVLFTMKGLAHLAEECGFTVLEAKYTQGGPQWAASILGSLASRGLVAISSKRPMLEHPLCSPLLAAGAAFDYLRMPFARTAQMFLTIGLAHPVPSTKTSYSTARIQRAIG